MNSNASQPNLHVKYANFKSFHPHCHKLGATNYAYKPVHIKQTCVCL